MQLSWDQALDNTRRSRISRFPGAGDPRVGKLMLPALKPKFRIPRGSRIFTIGSCFARNIEEKLGKDFILPTRYFRVSKEEWAARPNGLLNEYNPGTMYQRITYALEGKKLPDATIVKSKKGYDDLALLGGASVTLERARERRGQIDGIYAKLPSCQVVIITLGLVEAWFDRVHQVYLNRMPPHEVMRREPTRFLFRRMDLFEAYPLLEKAIAALVRRRKNVLLTVSPVPLQVTFSGHDAAVANEFSKSVLRVCAQRLADKYAQVDYFPSYEIVRDAGSVAYLPDRVHVKDDVVGQIIQHMLAHYVDVPAMQRAAALFKKVVLKS
jgi:hypothetical protein